MTRLELGYDVPAHVGMPLSEVATPALIIDLDAFDRNLRRMKDEAERLGLSLRAHAKTHKSADIARLQMDQGGAVGICCQKVSEAEALGRAGVNDILISNQVTDPLRIERLAALAQAVTLSVCVDDATVAKTLSAAAERHGVTLTILVEMDCGGARCGTAPGAETLALARAVAALPHLTFGGIQSYHGTAQHIQTVADRRVAIEAACRVTADTLALLTDAGLPCATVTGAGTGSYPFEAASGLYTELQCGSYVFMDADYGRIEGESDGTLGFENALFVLGSVISHPTTTRAVCDAGLKVLAVDSGPPLIFDGALGGLPNRAAQGVIYAIPSDEHGTLEDPRNALRINDRIALVPGHCDPTCNLHDWYVGVRNGRVESLWPITARGKVF